MPTALATVLNIRLFHSNLSFQAQTLTLQGCHYSERRDGVSTTEQRLKWLSRWPKVTSWFFPEKQVHGIDVWDVDVSADQNWIGDAIVTSNRSYGIGVWGSDCPGLVIDCGDAFGIAHCGWRGVAAELPLQLVDSLRKKSPRPPEDWQALIGPGVCGGCYEVDGPVLNAFDWPSNCLTSVDANKAQLDLRGSIEHVLKKNSIKQISHLKLCTFESPLHHSYRRDGRGPNQLLIYAPLAV